MKHVFLTQCQLGVVDRVAKDVPNMLMMAEPKKFEGARLAKALENFIWDMKEYFVIVKIPE